MWLSWPSTCWKDVKSWIWEVNRYKVLVPVDGRYRVAASGTHHDCCTTLLNRLQRRTFHNTGKTSWLYTHTHTHNYLEIHRISVSVSVSAANVWANSRPTFDTLSVSAWRELYFGWSAKVSHRAWDHEARMWLIVTHDTTRTRCQFPAVITAWFSHADIFMLKVSQVTATIVYWRVSFSQCTAWVRVQSTVSFGFVFGRKCHLTFGRHLASPKTARHFRSYFRFRPNL